MTVDVMDETEAVDCAICGASSDVAWVVGTRARFDLPLRNVACQRCGLVYVSPRPTQRALEAYYATQYRAHYNGVRIPGPNGQALAPGDEGFDEVWADRHRAQAATALRFGGAKSGARVLEVGCGDGMTLGYTREIGNAEVFGVEPDVAEAAKANERGIPCFCGTVEAYEPEERFDQVQMFHVLEHLRDPLAMLVKLASLLRPGGRLVIEVPNVTQPYGLLEGNFFQNAHIYNFSPNTLGALFRRAGLRVVGVVDMSSLLVVGEPLDDMGALPLDYDDSMLAHADQDGTWVAERLRTYRDLERQKVELFQQMNLEGIQRFCKLLGQPPFAPHLVQTVGDVVDYALRLQAYRVALVILRAAAAGPHADDIASGFAETRDLLSAKMKEMGV